MNRIIISSNDQIKAEAEKINIGKIGRNSSEDEELYFVLRFLQNNLNDICLTFPFSILLQDKPDIVLKDKYKDIGIEITLAINESYQKAKMIRDEENTSLILEPSLYKNNKDRKYIKDTIRKSNRRLYGSAYIDDELEEETAELILTSINKKIAKFITYDKFKENFLLINSESLFADEGVVVDYVRKKLEFMSDVFFDKIILRLNGKNIFLV